MTKDLLIYFVTQGPKCAFCPDGTEVWQVEAQVSRDGGETMGPNIFTFETEGDAISFKMEVNLQMEPMKIGEDSEHE